jgi:hypothetical protein
MSGIYRFQQGGPHSGSLCRRSAWVDAKALEAAAAKSAMIGNEQMPDRVRWIRSYVVNEPDGSLGTVCIYEARDEESIREHA